MALTLKNVNSGGGNSGTAATVAGSELFERALGNITGAAQGVLDSNKAIATDASANTTQGLIQGLDTATAANINFIRSQTQAGIDDPSVTRADRGKLQNKLNTLDADVATRKTTAIDLAFARNQTAVDQSLQGARNEATVADLDQAAALRAVNNPNAIINAIEAQRVKNVAANQAPKVEALQTIITNRALLDAQEKEADVTTINSIVEEGLKTEPTGSAADFESKFKLANSSVANINNPVTRKAELDRLLSENGLTKTEYARRVMSEFPKDKDGLINKIKLADKLNAGLEGTKYKFSDPEVSAIIAGRESLSGATTKKELDAEKDKEIRLSDLRIAESIAEQKAKSVSDQQAPGALIEALDTVVSPGFWSVFDRGQFILSAQTALEAGVPFDEIIRSAGKHGRSSAFANANPEDFDAAMTKKIAAANKKAKNTSVDEATIEKFSRPAPLSTTAKIFNNAAQPQATPTFGRVPRTN